MSTCNHHASIVCAKAPICSYNPELDKYERAGRERKNYSPNFRRVEFGIALLGGAPGSGGLVTGDIATAQALELEKQGLSVKGKYFTYSWT